MDSLTPDDPQQIGPYSIRAHLGSGGMGQVYLGQSPDGQQVAIKVMHGRRAQADDRARFRREVRAAQRVSGPYTAKILAADTEADLAWYASEYKPGLTLAETVYEHGKLPVDTVRTLAWGLFHALEQIHAARLVHRDLKPGNIILGPDNPSVIDYGIAHHEDDVALTQIGTIVGTAHYLCPEQVIGGRPQPSWDIFAFGSLLVYALTGHRAFGHDKIGAEVIMAIKDDDPDLRGVPRVFLPLIQRCLEKAPDRRQSLDDIRQLMPRKEAPTKVQPTWLPEEIATHVQQAIDSTAKFVGQASIPRRRRTIPTRRERYLPMQVAKKPYIEVKRPKKTKGAKRRRWLLPLIFTVLAVPALTPLAYKLYKLHHYETYAEHLAKPHFTPAVPGSTYAKHDPSSSVHVDKTAVNNYRLTVSVTAGGFDGKGGRAIAQACVEIVGDNSTYVEAPLDTTTSKVRRENGVPKQSGTIAFDLTLPGQYDLILDCQGQESVPAKLGTNQIDTRSTSYNGQLLSVMGEMRQGDELLIFERGAKSLLGAECLKTASGLVYPLEQEQFGVSSTEFWALTFRNSTAGGQLYPYCYTDEKTAQTDHVGAGIEV